MSLRNYETHRTLFTIIMSLIPTFFKTHIMGIVCMIINYDVRGEGEVP